MDGQAAAKGWPRRDALGARRPCAASCPQRTALPMPGGASVRVFVVVQRRPGSVNGSSARAWTCAAAWLRHLWGIRLAVDVLEPGCPRVPRTAEPWRRDMSFWNTCILAYCRLGIAGLSPRAPGTAGSALAALLAPLIFLPLPLWGRLLFLAVIVVTGGLAATRAEILLGRASGSPCCPWARTSGRGPAWSGPSPCSACSTSGSPGPCTPRKPGCPPAGASCWTISWPVSWPCAACWCCGPWAGSRGSWLGTALRAAWGGRPPFHWRGKERGFPPYLPPSALYSERMPGRPDASRMGCGLAGTENKKDAETSFLFSVPCDGKEGILLNSLASFAGPYGCGHGKGRVCCPHPRDATKAHLCQ